MTVLNYRPSNGDVEIPLNTEDSIVVHDVTIEFAKTAVYFDQHNKHYNMSLSLDTTNKEITYPFSFEILVRYAKDKADSNPKTEKLTVVCQNERIVNDIYEADPAKAIGRGMNLAGELAGYNQLNRVLDYSSIYQEMEDSKISNPSMVAFQISDSRYSETTSEYSLHAGFSGSGGTKGVSFSGAISAEGAESTTQKDYYEYNIVCVLKKMLQIQLNRFLDKDASFYAKYMDSIANDALNNPSSEEYNQYPNTKDGIYKLLRIYGTHVMTSGVFGGRHFYVYARKENLYQNSTSAGAEASLSLKDPLKVGGSPSFVDAYLAKLKQCGVDMTAGGSGYDENIEETTASIAVVRAIGGNASNDIDSWDASVTPDNMRNYALIGYGPSIEKGNSTADTTGGLVELTNFVLEPERKAALEKYLWEYISEQQIEADESRMVLADVYMYKDSDNGHGGIDPSKQLVLTSPDGKKRLYTAMSVNKYGPDDEPGKALETSKNPYIDGVADACDQYWFYALDWSPECSGIESIIFDDEASGYEQRGARADDEMNWPAIDNNYLWVKYRQENSTADYITGFGIAVGSKENNISSSNLKLEDVIASSGGTEMTQPFTTDTQFEKYWKDNNLQYNSNSHSWWGNTSCVKMYLYPVFTKVPLAKSFKFRSVTLPESE